MQMCQADESNLPLSPRTQSFFDSRCLRDREKIAVMVAIFASSILIGLLSINREYFTFGTETDFLSSYMREARRFLTGEPCYSLTTLPCIRSYWRNYGDGRTTGSRLVFWSLGSLRLLASQVHSLSFSLSMEGPQRGEA